MAISDRMQICSVCGHPNDPDNVSCESCYADLSGNFKGDTGPGQLALLTKMLGEARRTNKRLGQLTLSLWLIFALFVAWTVAAGLMGVGGPAEFFRWPL